MKSIFTKHLLHICFFLFGFYASAIVLAVATDNNKSVVSVLNSLSVFFASAGAFAALFTLFHIVYAKSEESENKEVNYFKFIIFMLHVQIEFLTRCEETMAKYKNLSEDERAISLNAYGYDEKLTDTINIEECIFLLSSPNQRLLLDLDRSQRWFKACMNEMKSRSSVFINDYNKPLSKHIKPNDVVNAELISEIAGHSVLPELIRLTNSMYDQQPKVKEFLTNVQSNVNYEMRRRYPHRTFVD